MEDALEIIGLAVVITILFVLDTFTSFRIFPR